MKSHMGPNSKNALDVRIWCFVFLPRFALPKVLCGKTHCHDNQTIAFSGQLFGALNLLE
jgi:hypothetical protein